MKITVVKEFTFEAAHYLPGYDGPCKDTHGHHYVLQVGVEGIPDCSTGMVEDFSRLKHIITKIIIDKLDHKYLNALDIPFFPSDMPTAENMVRWIVEVLCNYWPALSFVRLYETPTSYAEWRAE